MWSRSKRGCGCGWRGIDHAPHEKSQYFSWLFLKYSGSYAMISNADWLAGTILLRCFQLWDNLVHHNLLWVCGWFAPLATHSSVSVKRKEFCVAVSVKCFLPFSPFPSHLELTNYVSYKMCATRHTPHTSKNTVGCVKIMSETAQVSVNYDILPPPIKEQVRSGGPLVWFYLLFWIYCFTSVA